VPHSHTRLARTLTTRRDELRLRVEAVAVEVGVSSRTIERYEAGKIIPPPPSLRLLAQALDLELVELEDMARIAHNTRRRAAHNDGGPPL
jgi:transcriptional regulator with XRE-family HTH domain